MLARLLSSVSDVLSGHLPRSGSPQVAPAGGPGKLFTYGCPVQAELERVFS